MMGGCADKTGILVEVTSSDLSIPADVDALRFDATSDEDHTVSQTFAVDGAWPHSLTIVPASGTETDVTVEVTGLKSGAFVVRRVVRASFVRGTTRHVEVVLSRACLGVQCGSGVDCVDGMCVGQPADGGVDGGMPLSDAGTDDAGTGDAGALDAAIADAGMLDAGMLDAGMLDGGTDAGSRDAGHDAGTGDAGPPSIPALIFSEYIEGSSNNKALEIANLGSDAVDLARCELDRYSNGAVVPVVIPLTGTVAVGDVFVACHSSIADTSPCDFTTTQVNHNGDDAYALVCDGTTLDTFGRIGEDPSAGWWGADDGLETAEYVLRRLCSVTSGDTNGMDAFDPAMEWEGMPWASDVASNFTGLGARGCP